MNQRWCNNLAHIRLWHSLGFLSVMSLVTLHFAFLFGLRYLTKGKQVSFDTKSPFVSSFDIL